MFSQMDKVWEDHFAAISVVMNQLIPPVLNDETRADIARTLKHNSMKQWYLLRRGEYQAWGRCMRRPYGRFAHWMNTSPRVVQYYSNPCYALRSTQKGESHMTKLKFISWNINSDRRVSTSNIDHLSHKFIARPFAAYSEQERLPMIKSSLNYCIDSQKIGIFALQEVEDAIVSNMIEHFKSKGLVARAVKYNPSVLAFNYIFAYDPARYTMIDENKFILLNPGKCSKIGRQCLRKISLHITSIVNSKDPHNWSPWKIMKQMRRLYLAIIILA